MNYELSTLTLLCCLVSAATTHAACNSNMPASIPDSQLTDNGNGTVTDNKTGLMWKQCVEGLSGNDCATGGSASIFTWQQALQQPGVVNGTGFAGYTDWRLPNTTELYSLVETKCFGPAINTTYFPNTPSSNVWSGSPLAASSDRAWNVDFNHGFSDYDYRVNGSAVRLVRGGQ